MAEEADEQMSKSVRIMSKLIDKAFEDRRKAAAERAVRCLLCFDSGMDCGRFCSCEAGARLHYGHG